MMRPMKLAGSELMFGVGCLDYIKDMKASNVMIVIGGSSMEKNGLLDKVSDKFRGIGAQVEVVKGVEPDPHFSTVLKGAKKMLTFEPDLIVALGGGSVMDAAKAMWIYYEHPDLNQLDSIMPPNPFPKLRAKARFCCIPSTSGTASEVSRSVVITDDETGLKYGLGNMEMMPDIAICDPEVTVSMPAHITAETGMDALTHALEALVSNRANYVSNVLASQAVRDIITHLPNAYENGQDLESREMMLNASMIAGMAFTNVSLGIVHSMAHALGGYYKLAHGLLDAILLPYVIEFNSGDNTAMEIYAKVAREFGSDNLQALVSGLNKKLNIPLTLAGLIDKEQFVKALDTLAKLALADGCTKTNPMIPTERQLKDILMKAYEGA